MEKEKKIIAKVQGKNTTEPMIKVNQGQYMNNYQSNTSGTPNIYQPS